MIVTVALDVFTLMVIYTRDLRIFRVVRRRESELLVRDVLFMSTGHTNADLFRSARVCVSQ